MIVGTEWPPVLAAFGPGGVTAAHAHHAIHVVLAREGSIEVVMERTMRVAGVVTGPDRAHAIDARGTDVLIVFVEPESAIGIRLSARLDGGFRAIDARERDRLVSSLPGTDLESVTRWLGLVSGEEVVAPSPMHPGVRRVLRALEGEERSLEELADLARVSSSRLVHVFSEQVGVPLRNYRLWRRLQRAAVAIARGLPFATAAAEAGFADAAHMTRTFRRMLGATPTEIRDRSRFVQDPALAGRQAPPPWTNEPTGSSPGSGRTTKPRTETARTSSSTPSPRRSSPRGSSR